MHILQLTCHFSPNVGGVETHLDDLVEELVKRNNKVTVLTYMPLMSRARTNIFEKNGKLKVLRIPWIRGYFYKFVRHPFVEFIFLAPMLFLATPFVILFFRPEVVHTHGLIAGFAGVFWKKVFGIRTITTTHSMYIFPKKGLYRSFARWILKNSDIVLTLSKQSAYEIKSLGINANKIKVFTYWIDLTKFKRIKKAKEKLGWNKKFVVFSVGRLIKEKGIDVLLRSLKKWNKKINLVIVGSGPLEKDINEQLLIFKNLIFLGYIDNDGLPLYYSASDLTIVPSTHEEGFGRVIIESLACGTPVIGSNRGAIPEAMDESVGRLIQITSENIKKEVGYLYDNPKLLDKLSKNAVVYSRKKYGVSNIKTIIDSYK